MGGLFSCHKPGIDNDQSVQNSQNPQRFRTLPIDPFDQEFDALIHQLQERSDVEVSIRLDWVMRFSERWNIERIEEVNLYESWNYALEGIIPLKMVKRQLIICLRLCLSGPSQAWAIYRLPETLKTVQEALLLLEQLFASNDDLDRNLYCLVSTILADSILQMHVKTDLDRYIGLIAEQRSGTKFHFYLQRVEENSTLKRAVEILRTILTRLQQNFAEEYQLLLPYYFPDAPKGIQNIVPFDANYPYHLAIDDILDLIPDTFLVISDKALAGDYGLTLYNNIICLNACFFRNDSEICVAQCFITILHELAHSKSIKFHSVGHYVQETPEIRANTCVWKEAETWLETLLFGDKVDFCSLNSFNSSLIIDPDNYLTRENLQNLRSLLKRYLKNTMSYQKNH